MLTNLRIARLSKEIKLTDLAKTVGVSISFLSRIEMGKVRGSENTRNKIAEALKVPVKQLFGY